MLNFNVKSLKSLFLYDIRIKNRFTNVSHLAGHFCSLKYTFDFIVMQPYELVTATRSDRLDCRTMHAVSLCIALKSQTTSGVLIIVCYVCSKTLCPATEENPVISLTNQQVGTLVRRRCNSYRCNPSMANTN